MTATVIPIINSNEASAYSRAVARERNLKTYIGLTNPARPLEVLDV